MDMLLHFPRQKYEKRGIFKRFSIEKCFFYSFFRHSHAKKRNFGPRISIFGMLQCLPYFVNLRMSFLFIAIMLRR
jgi:hypothetical protein